MQKDRDAKRKSAEHLLTTATQQEQIVATKEASLASTKAIKDASLAASAATRAGHQEQAAARLEEFKRRNDLQDAENRRKLYNRAEEKHPGYKTLLSLRQEISNMSSTPKLPFKEQEILDKKIKEYNVVQKIVHDDANATATREFNVGDSGFTNFRQGRGQ